MKYILLCSAMALTAMAAWKGEPVSQSIGAGVLACQKNQPPHAPVCEPPDGDDDDDTGGG